MAIEHAAEPGSAVRRGILEQIASPAGFALLYVNGIAAAVGLGVVSGPWVGIFCMATDIAYRRRGAASAILRTLAIWAQLYGAERAYLQVMADNAAARALYERVGFLTVYHYFYRERVL